MKHQLDDGQHIVAAWAEHARGSGWHNPIVNVLVCDRVGRHRIVVLQPDEQSADVKALFEVSVAAHTSMTAAVMSSVVARMVIDSQER